MVTWSNDDTATHTVTSGNGDTGTPDGVFDSKFLNPGQKYSFIFDKSGKFPYFCQLHPFMRGSVTVS
jgi:plastocyanin